MTVNNSGILFGTGIPLFTIGVESNHNAILDRIDTLQLPRLVKNPAIEFIVAHDDDSLNLDGPDTGYLPWAVKIASDIRARGYEPIAVGFHPAGKSPRMWHSGEMSKAVARTKAMVRIAHAAGTYLIGPWETLHGDVDPQNNPNNLYKPISQIGDFADELNTYALIEMIRRKETSVFNSLEETEPFLLRLASPKLGIHYDTCHSFLEDGENLVANVQRLFTTGVKTHIHISECGDWDTPTNRGPLLGGPVAQQLTRVLQTLVDNEYDGYATFEGFHPVFYSTVGRSDPAGISKKLMVAQNSHALSEAKISIDAINEFYATIK